MNGSYLFWYNNINNTLKLNKNIMAKRTMVIDANFMMHRFSRDYDFIQNPEQDMINYQIDLCNHIACEVERVKAFVDNIVIVKDSRSWRKDVEQINIDYVTKSVIKEINYKENRTGSEKSVRNDELLYQAFNDFTDCLERDFNLPQTHIYGAEGDDAIWAWTQYLRNEKLFSCVYCSDSDIIQTISPSNSVIRRIRSKVAQNGEIIIHPAIHNQMNKFVDDPFNYNPLKWTHENLMIENRQIGSGLRIENPDFIKLKLILLGSVKDNVSEAFTWPSTNNNQVRHVNEKHIIKALDKFNLKENDIRESMLYDDTFLIDFFNETIKNAKPKSLNETQKIYFDNAEMNPDLVLLKLHSNRKMNILNKLEIPEKVQNDLNKNIKAKCRMLANIKDLNDSKLIQDAMNITNNKLFQTLNI